MLKLTTDRHEASRGLFATAELLVAARYYAYAGIQSKRLNISSNFFTIG